MKRSEIEAAIGRGRAERKTVHWDKLEKKKEAMQSKIDAANTPEKIDKLLEKLGELSAHHTHRGSKDREYKCYEEAEKNDDYVEMYDELYLALCDKKDSL